MALVMVMVEVEEVIVAVGGAAGDGSAGGGSGGSGGMVVWLATADTYTTSTGASMVSMRENVADVADKAALYTNTMPAMSTHATTRCNCYILLCQEPHTGWLGGEAMQPTCHSDASSLVRCSACSDRQQVRCKVHATPKPIRRNTSGRPNRGTLHLLPHALWISTDACVCACVSDVKGPKSGEVALQEFEAGAVFVHCVRTLSRKDRPPAVHQRQQCCQP